jgi:hypothetical protein
MRRLAVSAVGAPHERQMNERLLQLAAGDKYCPTQL